MRKILWKAGVIGVTAIVTAGLSDLTSPLVASAQRTNQFDICIREITSTGVSPGAAGTACSDALIPKELSFCVTRIKNKTPLQGDDILRACYQVRRPVDLANCVIDIARVIPAGSQARKQEEKPAPDAKSLYGLTLDSCRRSLLPGRHSECVIAVSRESKDATLENALNTCLSAEDFPRDLFPSYSN
ncbi:MAG: hypothetical protein N5P05_000474 [Chroococcopsis gigantea SAG 12.99]|jgi:hypothetical protein|nr:hypothetical protein [Chlorogloea purpurea SAG 13.99]MDV2998868.1 hypothetical protein [Chroococcopsis gigantea SAG 12.99]